MDKAEYETLLDKGYADLPEVLYKKERFVIPAQVQDLIFNDSS